MAGYGNFPGPQSGIQPAIIVGGHHNDPASDHSSGMRVKSPLEHGSDVNISDLNFAQMMHTPSGFSQNSFQGVLDPGSLVYILKNVGTPGGIILGQGNPVLEQGGGQAGSGSLMGGDFQEQRKQDIGVSVPPDIQEGEDRGAKIRKIKEKGQMHSLHLLDGFPGHGALFDMTGFRIPEMKNIPTAKQKGQQMMTNDMMDQLQGTIGSLGGMLQGLMSGGGMGGFGGKGGGGGGGAGAGAGNFGVSFAPNGVAEPGTVDVSMAGATNNLSPQMKTAVNNLRTLVQGYDTSNGVAFATGGQVHEETYLTNAQELINQVTCLDDLMNCIKQLNLDDDLKGTDKLNVLEQEIETAWGTALQQVTYDGEVVLEYSQDAINAMATFANTLSSSNTTAGAGVAGFSPAPSTSAGGGSGSGGGGSKSGMGGMFGKASSSIMEMMQRLPKGGQQEMKQMTEKLSGGMDQQKLMQIVKSTIDGGNPLEALKSII